MNGNDFVNSEWCKKAASPATQSQIKENFGKWSSRVKNSGLVSRAKQLYQFFLSSKITGTQKIVVGGALLYVISPLDIIPDFIPVVGWLDDLGIAGFALSYVFSQMDNLAEFEASEEAEKAQKMSTEEILNEDIRGTGERAINFSVDNIDQDFSVSVDKKAQDLQLRINELSQIADLLHVTESKAPLIQIESRIFAMKMQKMAVLGRYSTGKSTLINALLDKNYLPTSPVPTTKAITYIMQGHEDSLYSEDVHGNIIIHESIKDLQNIYDGDITKARKVSLTLAEFPFADLAIADTPGLEDPDQSVAQLTLDIVPETDAIVVLLDAGYMESKVEFDFISSLLKNDRERKLFIVINKIDEKTPAEIVRLTKLCQSHLIEKGVETARIFPVSAKLGNKDEGFSKFKSSLFDFLHNDIAEEAYRHSKKELDEYSRRECNEFSVKSCMTQSQSYA